MLLKKIKKNDQSGTFKSFKISIALSLKNILLMCHKVQNYEHYCCNCSHNPFTMNDKLFPSDLYEI